MKTIYEYLYNERGRIHDKIQGSIKKLNDIYESLLDDEDYMMEHSIRDSIKKFIHDNYIGGDKCEITDEQTDGGKYIVNCSNSLKVKNLLIRSLTNGLFTFGTISKNFNCNSCILLESLEGAPKEVGGCFVCTSCVSLSSLNGMPEKISGGVICDNCKSLKTLEGAPKKVIGDFRCCECESLKTLKGAPKEIDGSFICNNCNSLKTLEGAPKKVINFDCSQCKSLTSLSGLNCNILNELDCSYCGQLKTLKGIPKNINTLRCSNCSDEFTIEYITSLTHVSYRVITGMGGYEFYTMK